MQGNSETAIQMLAYPGYEHLAFGHYAEASCEISSLLKSGERRGGEEKKFWIVYAGLLEHCLLCWRPGMRTSDEKIDEQAAENLVSLSYDEQEEFFVFSQRLEDSDDNRIAGLGMYLHYVLLKLTNDHNHSIPVIEDSIVLHEPLSSAAVAFEMLKDEKKKSNEKEIKELLQIGIDQFQPFAIECALMEQCKAMFEQDVLQKQLTEIYEKNGNKETRALFERSRIFSAADAIPLKDVLDEEEEDSDLFSNLFD